MQIRQDIEQEALEHISKVEAQLKEQYIGHFNLLQAQLAKVSHGRQVEEPIVPGTNTSSSPTESVWMGVNSSSAAFASTPTAAGTSNPPAAERLPSPSTAPAPLQPPGSSAAPMSSASQSSPPVVSAAFGGSDSLPHV